MAGKSQYQIIQPQSNKESQLSKLWIGNLDPRVTEYHLIQIFKIYGEISSFDFLFHRSGPSKGEPKGFCFVEYKFQKDAVNAKHHLNGKVISSRAITVGWAHDKPVDPLDDLSEKGVNKKLNNDDKKDATIAPSRQAQMFAIEQKLKSLEQNKETSLSKHPILLRQETSQTTTSKPYGGHLNKHKNKHRGKPYQK